MSSDPGTPTLDQLRVFLTVVDVGTFAAAARKLGRATSVISYSVSNLEGQLGIALFERDTTRKPILTEAGRTVLAEVRTVANGIDGLKAKVRGLLAGLEAEVNLAIDVMLPPARIVDALKAFRQTFPTTALRLHVETLGGIPQMIIDRRAGLAVSGPLSAGLNGMEHIAVGSVMMVPVAAPDHPLVLAGANAPGAARDHVQLVLTDRSRLTEGRDFMVIGTHTWRLADFGSKHLLLKEGVGWGTMPEPVVRKDIEEGRLVKLDLPESANRSYAFEVIYRSDTPPGPAASWLIARFQSQDD